MKSSYLDSPIDLFLAEIIPAVTVPPKPNGFPIAITQSPILALSGEWGSLFAELAQNTAESSPHRPMPMTQDELLGLFDSDEVGRDVVLQPATLADLCSVETLNKPSLEVVYDNV